MLTMISYVKTRFMSEKAQGIVEYALLVAAIVIIAGLVLTDATKPGGTRGGGSLLLSMQNLFTHLGSAIKKAMQ